ncbi:hypothetical protein [Nonomuraea sp. B19D2]|uniref:hypothetical protein n=1 Tax=Nonomuraea sp. B19D2 TaxID=3159561 RepID=UPI0032DB978E
MSSQRRKLFTAAAILVVVLGGAAWIQLDSQNAAAYTLSKQRYIASVEAACRAAGAESWTAAPTSPQDEVAELKHAAHVMSTTVAQVAAVPPPKTDAKRVQQEFILPLQTQADRLRRLARSADQAVQAEDEKTALALVEQSLSSTWADDKARSFAADYGIAACAGPE